MPIPNKIPTPYFDTIEPQTCVNGKLRKLHRLINTAYQSKLKRFNVRGSMLSILFIIGKRPQINQKKIAEILLLDQSTMSRDLKKLIVRGLVDVHKGRDTRNSMLVLSDKGYALVEEVAPIWAKLHHTVHAILGQYHINQIDTLITALQNNMEQLKE